MPVALLYIVYILHGFRLDIFVIQGSTEQIVCSLHSKIALPCRWYQNVNNCMNNCSFFSCLKVRKLEIIVNAKDSSVGNDIHVHGILSATVTN